MIFVLAIIFVCSTLADSATLPSFVKVCKRTDPNLSECAKKSALELLPRIRNGSPELNLPSINPFKVPELILKTADFQIKFQNLELYVGDIELEAVNIVLDAKVHAELRLTFSEIFLKSTYQSSGKLLMLQMNGKGDSTGNFTNLGVDLKTVMTLVTRDGKQFIDAGLSVDEINIKLGKGHLHLSNIMGDDKHLNDLIDTTINENMDALLNEFKPMLSKIIDEITHNILKKFFDNFAFDDLFPL